MIQLSHRVAGLAALLLVCECTTRSAPDGGGSGGIGNSNGGSASEGRSGGASSGGKPGGGSANTNGGRASEETSGGAGGQAGSGTGGSDSSQGGDANPEEEPFDKPELVTSGRDTGYFEAGHLTLSESSPTTVVHLSDKRQVFRGFGGSFNERAWVALLQLSDEDRALAMKLLFSRREGANFVWGRIPMGASTYARERFTYDDITEGTDYPLDHFSIDRDRDDHGGVIPYVKAAQAVRKDIKFWSSPWTPPPWMKTNNDYDEGSMKNAHAELATYANYFVKFVEAYEAEGIPIHHVFPQNEPDWIDAIPSCSWGPSNSNQGSSSGTPFLGEFVATQLGPALRAAELDTEIWYGTFSDGNLCDEYWDNLVDAGGVNFIQGAGLQWSCTSIIAPMRQAKSDLTIMMSEHPPGNLPWKSPAPSLAEATRDTFWRDQAPNNHSYATETWDLIKSWVVTHEVNAYSIFHMALDHMGLGLLESQLWPQNALLAVDTQTKKLTVTPAYYVVRHISQFVDDGAFRLTTTGGDAIAFQNPDHSIVVVLYNKESIPAASAIEIGDNVYDVTVPASGWATLNVELE